ncbi:uncharacterized protein PG986_004302 [Apiospora aurea]|uniref:Uncharacterized protein n=1 Tax=Apiospora aurea TaxID=335848 RepID=A0ABR1QM75_9PEZI
MEDFPDIKDFGALADAAAAERLSSQRVLSTPFDSPMHHHGPAAQTQTQTGSATQSMSQSRTPSSAAAQNPGDEEGEDDESDDAPPPAPIGSDISAWQTAIQTLPAEFRNQQRFQHPLASLLSDQKTIRQIEWNPNRQNGGFVPRTPNDFSSMMIFICGQINPNPCRNCRLKNGPFARCVVAPPEILAVSTIRHASAEPVVSGMAPPKVRKPKSHAPKTRPPSGPVPPYGSQASHHQYPQHTPYAGGSVTQTSIPTQPLPTLGKPSSDSGSVKSFADKVRMVRAWNLQSRRRMKAELLQWQAALATHGTAAASCDSELHVAHSTAVIASTTVHSFVDLSAIFCPSVVVPAVYPYVGLPQYPSGLPNGNRTSVFQPSGGDIDMGDQDDGSDVTDSEDDEEGGGGGEDHTWAGFDDDEADRVMIKPPIP